MGLLQAVENGGRGIGNTLQDHVHELVRQKTSVDEDVVEEKGIRRRGKARHCFSSSSLVCLAPLFSSVNLYKNGQ